MLYNIHDSSFSKVIKQMVFWLSLSAMTGLFIFLVNNEIKLPQRHITVEIDIKNKINICQIESQKDILQKKLYQF